MTEVTAQALADHYVSLVGEDMDVTAANEWAATLTDTVDEDMRREAAEIAARLLNEQEAAQKAAVEAPVEASEETSPETTTDVQGEDTPSENA